MSPQPALALETLDDAALAARIAARDVEAVRLLMTRHNQRLLRTARAVLRDRAEAEDALQEAYLKAFRGISEFRGEASLTTWLTRIVLNEALARRRSQLRRAKALDQSGAVDLETYRSRLAAGSDMARSPEAETARKEISRLLERALAELPPNFRLVFVMREIEGLSVEETAETLEIPAGTVKTRLLRAKERLRRALDPELKDALGDAFAFLGPDCERLTGKVIAALGW
jgi:RNA polymerase sigma-70 factor (ECF subfamily)